jgi:hypothetical protein
MAENFKSGNILWPGGSNPVLQKKFTTISMDAAFLKAAP